MSSETNVAKVRRLLKRGFGEGDLSVIDEYVAALHVEHQGGYEGEGPEAMKRLVRDMHASFGHMTLEIEDLVASGDDVWVRSRASGVNTSSLMGCPPTGREIDIHVVDIFRLRDGAVVEHWGVSDRLGILEQCGLIEGPRTRAA
jgi:predicted ester cyclase